MNKVMLMGRLTKDPDIRYSQGENSTCIANFRIAVDRRFVRQNQDGAQTADYFNIVAFGKLGEHVERYYRKGLKTVVTGRLQSREYNNRDGVRVYVTEVVAEELEFAESKNASAGNYGGSQGGGYGGSQGGNSYGGSQNGNYGGGNRGTGYGNSQSAGTGSAPDTLDGFMNIPDGIDEELPFV